MASLILIRDVRTLPQKTGWLAEWLYPGNENVADDNRQEPKAESFHTVHLLQITMATIGSMGATLCVFCSP